MHMHLSSSEPILIGFSMLNFFHRRWCIYEHIVCAMYFADALCTWTSIFVYRKDKYLIQIPKKKSKFSTLNLLPKLISLHFKLVKKDKSFCLSSFQHWLVIINVHWSIYIYLFINTIHKNNNKYRIWGFSYYSLNRYMIYMLYICIFHIIDAYLRWLQIPCRR